jgi:hypothetical protein
MEVVWNGTEAESRDLLDVLARHCACEYSVSGARTRVCAPHYALAHTQRFLDGMLFARRIRDRLLAEEQSSSLTAGSRDAGLPRGLVR